MEEHWLAGNQKKTVKRKSLVEIEDQPLKILTIDLLYVYFVDSGQQV